MSSWSNFSNFSNFIHMGGYAFYVWTSYGLGLVVLVANVLLPIWNRKRLERELSRRIRREDKR